MIKLTPRLPGWEHYTVGETENYTVGGTEIWVKGPDSGQIHETVASIRPANLKAYLQGLRGHFAIVVRAPTFSFAAVDRIRSIPLIWLGSELGVVVAQHAEQMIGGFPFTPDQVNPDGELAIAMSGYTVGRDTLYSDVSQLGPGQFLLIEDEITVGQYHRYEPWKPVPRPREELLADLTKVTVEVFQRLMDEANGRTIAIPLSAGWDSRLVASSLRSYSNVVCFSYGLAGNHEAKTAQRVAEALGFDWHFIPYSPRRMRKAFASEDHEQFVRSADSMTGIHFPQEYLALREKLPDDSIIVNGQSGDFISGNHIPAALMVTSPGLSAEARRDRVIDALLSKHYNLWGHLCTPKNLARMRARLTQEIEALGGMPDPDGDHGIYEALEFQNRQAKYVINGQRVYDHFGYDWSLPLWSDEYLDFWQGVPLEAKIDQNLYREMCQTQKWGDVWDIPINNKTIRPRWLIPFRTAAKLAHAPLGRERWHAFERRFLGYWMENLCGYPVSYMTSILDARPRRNSNSYHVESYLRCASNASIYHAMRCGWTRGKWRDPLQL